MRAPPNDSRKRVGAFVRALRCTRQLTQAELAERVGLTRVSITNIEGGRQSLTLDNFYLIVDALGYQAKFQIKPK